jgi:hypothetical protein
MQIHIDTSGSPGQVVTIFSKSKRDSTFDRIKTHPYAFNEHTTVTLLMMPAVYCWQLSVSLLT